MLKLENEFKELESAGIIKNLICDDMNLEFRFDLGVPEDDVIKLIKKYVYETYGFIIKCSE